MYSYNHICFLHFNLMIIFKCLNKMTCFIFLSRNERLVWTINLYILHISILLQGQIWTCKWLMLISKFHWQRCIKLLYSCGIFQSFDNWNYHKNFMRLDEIIQNLFYFFTLWKITLNRHWTSFLKSYHIFSP